MSLKIDQTLDIITRRMMDHALAVLFEASRQVGRHANVEGTSVVTGENIDNRIALHGEC